MPRFLSTEWFDLVTAEANGARPKGPPPNRRLVIEQAVKGSPDGDISYLVVIEDGSARIERAAAEGEPPDLTITTSWATAAAVAAGTLSAQRALMEGRLRVGGDLSRLYDDPAGLAGLDPLPPGARQQTTY